MHFQTRFTLALACVLAAACDGAEMATAPEAGVRAVGILAWVAAPGVGGAAPGGAAGGPGAPRPGVTAPDTVRAGAPFPVVVTTVGPTVCWAAAGAQVEMQPGVANITPFDYTPEDQWTACGDALLELPRSVTISFPQPGDAVLRVMGRRVVAGNFQAEERVVLEKKIHVQ
ncbi:MAG TPA: hypothetical protein VF263_10520 [Longimicrobiaceae bacterium]